MFAVNSIIHIKNDGANAADVFPATGDDLGAGVNTAVSVASGASVDFIATVADATWTSWMAAGTGPILADDGTVGAPTYSFSSDPDTGIFRVQEDQMALVAGGLSCMSVRTVAGVRRIGFYDGSPVALQTGVAVTTSAVHAALVNLRLITA